MMKLGSLVTIDNKDLRKRIGLYLPVYGIVILLSLIVVLMFFDNIMPNTNQVVAEMSHLNDEAVVDLQGHFGEVAAEAYTMSKRLSLDFERNLTASGITFAELQENTDLIPDLLDQEVDYLLMVLNRSNCSGIFIILDATINPSVLGAENSRAGVYICKVEPERIGTSTPKIYLRGNTQSAIKRGIALRSSWDLEFDIWGQDYWNMPLEAINDQDEPELNNLLFWSFNRVIPKINNKRLICSIPILDSAGKPIGVCGLDVSETNFRYKHNITSDNYSGLVMSFSEINGKSIDLSNSLISGDRAKAGVIDDMQGIPAMDLNNALEMRNIGNENFRLLSKELPLYSNNSYFKEPKFAVTVYMPESVYWNEVKRDVLRLFTIIIVVLCLGIFTFMVLNRWLAKPLIDIDKTFSIQDLDVLEKPRTDFDELHEQLSMYKNTTKEHQTLMERYFRVFLTRMAHLTTKERIIVAYYAEGSTKEDICAKLPIHPNVLNVTDAHIYKKLGVHNEKELHLYIDLILRSDLRDQLIKLLSK